MSAVLIIGASRGIGLETVKLAIKAGHSIRAMARSATAIRLRGSTGKVARGGGIAKAALAEHKSAPLTTLRRVNDFISDLPV